jgi:glycosyltransferase involved in cell wall biosynthesis
LAAPDGEASRIVKWENNGLYVPAQRPEELAAAVLFLKENPSFTEELSRRSLAAAPKYSRERQASEMLAVLESAFQGSPAKVLA